MKSSIGRVLARALVRAATVLIAILVALALGEVVVRLFGLEPDPLVVRDPVLGLTYRPGLNAVLYDEEAGRKIAVAINSRGFRDVERPQTRDERVRRVVMLGDSFQAGLSVDADAAFTRVTERLLNERQTGSPWEVVSLAVAGFGTAQELLAYERFGRIAGPRIVVLNFFAGNDVSDNSSELSTSMRPYYHLDGDRLVLDPPSESRRRLTAWLNDHSRLYVWQKRAMQKAERLVKRNVVVDPVMRVFMKQEDPAVERAWTLTEALVLELNRQVEAGGATLLVSYIPFSDEVSPDWWEDSIRGSRTLASVAWDVDGPFRRIAAFCSANRIAFASARELLRPRGSERFYFLHGHFNERGHAEYARFLAGQIETIEAQREGR